MLVFVDTSALFAILDADDAAHLKAKDQCSSLLPSEQVLICSNYVVLESFALIQRRLGIQALRALLEDILPLINVEWVDETTHLAGVTALLAAFDRKLSLVDATSFVLMRKLGIKDSFTYDKHFIEEGFNCLT